MPEPEASAPSGSASATAMATEVDGGAVVVDARTAAAVKLQNFVRRRKEMATWSTLIQQLPQLRDMYMDREALEAGAASNPLYSARMLATREKLRTDPLVIAALDCAFDSLLFPGRSSVSRKAYYTMSRKLYLAAVLQDAEDTGEVDTSLLDPRECMRSIDADWATDSEGKSGLERERFHHVIFQLADLQTKGVSAEEYSNWVSATFRRVRLSPADRHQRAASAARAAAKAAARASPARPKTPRGTGLAKAAAALRKSSASPGRPLSPKRG
jgi:hypothetical protein